MINVWRFNENYMETFERPIEKLAIQCRLIQVCRVPLKVSMLKRSVDNCESGARCLKQNKVIKSATLAKVIRAVQSECSFIIILYFVLISLAHSRRWHI